VLAALAGGVGAARFLCGLVDVVPPEQITVVVNTGDDDEFHGLWVSPDVDSVLYALAGANNPDTGWGLADETFHAVDALGRYGVPTWFRLGDRDLATHLYRTERRRQGASLTTVTAELAAAWGVGVHLLPMTDDRVATRVTAEGPVGAPVELSLQEWFVRERAEPAVLSVAFDGAADSRPAPGVVDALAAAETILICPSNPVISIGPVLAVPGVREALAARRDRVVAVSPLIGGRPVKGPADRLMGPLDMEVSSVGVARAYRDVCATLVIDAADAADAPRIEALGVRPVVTDTLMRDARIAAALARETLAAVA
jgi:LPPG:FO 2-phospho-L-lactate transferase